ncbi:MAG: RDD family protein [Allopontixanthobacter sediminis]
MNRSASTPYEAASAKRRRTVVTPEGIALPFIVGARSARAGALIIDYLIITMTVVAVSLLLGWTFSGLIDRVGDAENLGGAAEFIFIAYIIFLFLARYGYFLAFEMGPRGATPGKRLVGLRVAARDGGRLTAEAVIARNLLRDIEIFLPLVFVLTAPSGEGGPAGVAAMLWFLVFMLFAVFNRDAMRAGDLVAGTWVVEAPRKTLAAALSTEGAARLGSSEVTGAEYKFGEGELAVYGEFELQTLERVLRDDKPEAIAAVAETICRKIGWHPGVGDERAFLEAFYAQLRARLEGGMRFGKRKADKFS